MMFRVRNMIQYFIIKPQIAYRNAAAMQELQIKKLDVKPQCCSTVPHF